MIYININLKKIENFLSKKTNNKVLTISNKNKKDLEKLITILKKRTGKYLKVKILEKYKKIVIKIGSSILVNTKNNKVKNKWLDSLCKDIKLLLNEGKKITIVSSGAVALGQKIYHFTKNYSKN